LHFVAVGFSCHSSSASPLPSALTANVFEDACSSDHRSMAVVRAATVAAAWSSSSGCRLRLRGLARRLWLRCSGRRLAFKLRLQAASASSRRTPVAAKMQNMIFFIEINKITTDPQRSLGWLPHMIIEIEKN
jgi:hypothetical protein